MLDELEQHVRDSMTVIVGTPPSHVADVALLGVCVPHCFVVFLSFSFVANIVL